MVVVIISTVLSAVSWTSAMFPGTYANDEQCEWNDAEDNTENVECRETSDGHQNPYKGARLSPSDSILLIMSYAMRHSLTGEALVDLLELLNSIVLKNISVWIQFERTILCRHERHC